MKVKRRTITVRRVDNRWLMLKVGALLRELRKAQGLTLQEVADGIGVTRGAVNNWELGKHQSGFMVERLYNLALFYKVPVRRLLP